MSNFLELTNKVLVDFNEVPLTDVTFNNATGFHSKIKTAVNQAVFDIYTVKDTEWPFLNTKQEFNTVIGTATYTKPVSVLSVDWDSFKIKRPTAVPATSSTTIGSGTGFGLHMFAGNPSYITVTQTTAGLTQTNGVATFNSTLPHTFITGDSVTISGANEVGYNVTANVTVITPTQFTYNVNVSTPSIATGNIVAKSNTVLQNTLKYKDIDSFREEEYSDSDANTNIEGYNKPFFIIRNNNILD